MDWSEEGIKAYQKKYRQKKKKELQAYKSERIQEIRAEGWAEKEKLNIKKANEKWMNS